MVFKNLRLTRTATEGSTLKTGMITLQTSPFARRRHVTATPRPLLHMGRFRTSHQYNTSTLRQHPQTRKRTPSLPPPPYPRPAQTSRDSTTLIAHVNRNDVHPAVAGRSSTDTLPDPPTAIASSLTTRPRPRSKPRRPVALQLARRPRPRVRPAPAPAVCDPVSNMFRGGRGNDERSGTVAVTSYFAAAAAAVAASSGPSLCRTGRTIINASFTGAANTINTVLLPLPRTRQPAAAAAVADPALLCRPTAAAGVEVAGSGPVFRTPYGEAAGRQGASCRWARRWAWGQRCREQGKA